MASATPSCVHAAGRAWRLMSSGDERGGGGAATAPTAEERCALAVAFLRASAANGRFDQVALSQLRRGAVAARARLAQR